jgi:hypothetical protein
VDWTNSDDLDMLAYSDRTRTVIVGLVLIIVVCVKGCHKLEKKAI